MHVLQGEIKVKLYSKASSKEDQTSFQQNLKNVAVLKGMFKGKSNQFSTKVENCTCTLRQVHRQLKSFSNQSMHGSSTKKLILIFNYCTALINDPIC